MNQSDANALLAIIVKYASLASAENFTLHATQGVHMSAVLASARAVADNTRPCGYFQHSQMETSIVKIDADGWEFQKKDWIITSTPTGRLENVSEVEYVRLLKAFFRGAVVAAPNGDAAMMTGPIPAGFTGATNALGTATYTAVTNMRVLVSGGHGSNWQLITVYPVA
jgi:hypothetical protein